MLLLLELRLLDFIVVLVFSGLFFLNQRPDQVNNTFHFRVGTEFSMRLHLLLAEGTLVLLKVLDGPFDTLLAEEVEAVFDDLGLDHCFHAN